MGGHVVGARGRATAVELPVQQRERDVVRHPDDRAGLEQVAGRVRLRAAVDERVDQERGRPQRPDDEHGDERDREHDAAPRERRVIAPGSAAITATSSAPSSSGSAHAGPSLTSSGRSTVRTIAATIAPAIGQRASALAISAGAASIRAGSMALRDRAPGESSSLDDVTRPPKDRGRPGEEAMQRRVRRRRDGQ